MPATIYVVNRYKLNDPVVVAAVTFDNEKIEAKTPRTAANGLVTVTTEALADGNHVLRITPPYTSTYQAGPDIAEDLPNSATRMYRSLEAVITVKNGRLQAVYPAMGQERNGDVGAGTNPIRVLLQPLYFRAPHQIPKARKHEQITLIVVHQTAGGTSMDVALSVMNGEDPQAPGSSHYVISSEGEIVKIVQDNGIAFHAGQTPEQTWWDGKKYVEGFSIGIEMSHKAKTPWPPAQISALMGLAQQLMHAYPSIKRQNIVGHTDVLLIDRDCPGLEFDWAVLEKFGLSMIPRDGAISLDGAYGGFFRLQPAGQLRVGDRDSKRVWGGGEPWPAAPATGAVVNSPAGLPSSAVQGSAGLQTIAGAPIRELQTDLGEIGYFAPVDGDFSAKTEFAVSRFQKHFFSGSRRGLIADAQRGRVDHVTAKFIKSVRP